MRTASQSNANYSFKYVCLTNVQYVANDTDAPHICAEWDSVKVHNLRCNEFWRSKQYLIVEQKKNQQKNAVSSMHENQNTTRNASKVKQIGADLFKAHKLNWQMAKERKRNIWQMMTNLQLFIWIISPCQSEIDNFNSITLAAKAQYIFWFQIQVNDIVTVYKLHCLTYLSHQNNAWLFG